jgi:hypothetical protein
MLSPDICSEKASYALTMDGNFVGPQKEIALFALQIEDEKKNSPDI